MKEKDTAAFLDPKNEYRALFAECWGTFLLVLVGAGAIIVSKITGEISKGMEVVAPGILVNQTDRYFSHRVHRAIGPILL